MITVGVVSTSGGHKVHCHANGWAVCGSGRLVESPRRVEDGDQMCRRCAKHLETRLIWEIEDMGRKRCLARVAILERFADSALTIVEVARRDATIVEMRANLARVWRERDAEPVTTVADSVTALTLF